MALADEVNYDDQPVRPCLGCGKSDKAPRDVVALPDGGTAYYHFDCHVMTHDCGVCKAVLEAVGTDSGSKGLKNERLLGAILNAKDPSTGPVPEIFQGKYPDGNIPSEG